MTRSKFMRTNRKDKPSARRHTLMVMWVIVIVLFHHEPPVQASDYRAELFGCIGMSAYLGTGPPVRGPNFAGGIGVRPFSADRSWLLRGIGAEFETNVTAATGSPAQAYYTGNVLYHLPLRSFLEPYVVLGIGASHEAGITHAAANLGFGTKVFINRRLYVRPEVRGFGTEYLGSFLRVCFGVGYCW